MNMFTKKYETYSSRLAGLRRLNRGLVNLTDLRRGSKQVHGANISPVYEVLYKELTCLKANMELRYTTSDILSTERLQSQMPHLPRPFEQDSALANFGARFGHEAHTRQELGHKTASHTLCRRR